MAAGLPEPASCLRDGALPSRPAPKRVLMACGGCCSGRPVPRRELPVPRSEGAGFTYWGRCSACRAGNIRRRRRVELNMSRTRLHSPAIVPPKNAAQLRVPSAGATRGLGRPGRARRWRPGRRSPCRRCSRSSGCPSRRARRRARRATRRRRRCAGAPCGWRAAG
jgi:hypothetical protein